LYLETQQILSMKNLKTRPNYSSSKIKEDNVGDVNYSNPLPRAVIRPNTYVLLDGDWQISPDPNNVGLQEKWYTEHEFELTAKWPGSVEQFMTKKQQADLCNDQVTIWYQREFLLPEHKKYTEFSPVMLQLTFGACGYETQVWLNGVLLYTVEGEEIHYGEYTSFSYELDFKLLKSVNRITVRIADTMDADIPRGKQESHVYKRGGIWYHTFTGPVRSIWLETVERNRLRSRVSVVNVLEDNLIRLDLTTHIHDPGSYTIKLKVYDWRQEVGGPIAVDEYPIMLEAGEKKQRLVIEIPEKKHWSPEDPHLYRLVAELVSAEGYSAEIVSLFGLRKVESRGGSVYLNNNPIYLDGILYQPGIATFEEIKRHMYAIQKLGCNLIRIHIAGIDPRIYNLADKLGILLWVEVPSPHRSTTKSRANHKDELLRMLALIGTHPSVIIWSLYNESWGAQDIATNADTRRYIIDIYNFMKITYPQFLVVDNDGWQHISFEGRLNSALLTVHIYTAVLRKWIKTLNDLVAGKFDGITTFPLIVGDPFFFRKQVPLIVSEWGGFGFVDYGGPKDLTTRTEKIRRFKQELRKRSIAGDVYTQATNIEEERNGLIEADTGKLKVPKRLLSSK
jgi:hypothetical protein